MGDTNFAYYERLRNAGLEALAASRLTEAYESFDEAYSWAQEHGDSLLQDQAFCSRSAVAVELFPVDEPLARLRVILMRNQDSWSCRLAAYTIARIYELKKSCKKGLFYARIARDLSYQLGREDWIASSHNMMGNLLLAESFFDEAYAEYQEGLDRFDTKNTVQRAILLENVGYCRVVQGEIKDGFRLLFESLRSLRRLKADGYQAYPHLSLCYAYMESGRWPQALRHGLRALALGKDRELQKNALYLLGETANLMGDPDRARDFLLKLQQEHYPDTPHIVDFLMKVDVRQFINLKA